MLKSIKISKRIVFVITTIIVSCILLFIFNTLYHLYISTKDYQLDTGYVKDIYNEYEDMYTNIESKMNAITVENDNYKWWAIKKVNGTDSNVTDYYNQMVSSIRFCYNWSSQNNLFDQYKKTLNINYSQLKELKNGRSSYNCLSKFTGLSNMLISENPAVRERLSFPIYIIQMVEDYSMLTQNNSNHYEILKTNNSFGITDYSLPHSIKNAIYVDFYNLLYNDYIALKITNLMTDFLYNELTSY